MILPITLTFAAVAVVINIWLAIRIVRLRISGAISHGDGGNVTLSRRIRAQSNFIENAPFVLILCGLIELARGSESWLWALMLIFSLARVAHGMGMDSDQPGPPRKFGTMATLFTLVILAGVALYSVYTRVV